jgi:hypothetical protein
MLTHLLVRSYRVEEVVFVKAGDQPRRVLGLRRLDQLNMTHSELGLDSTELGDPVLLLDQIDKHVPISTLPVLAPGAMTVYQYPRASWGPKEADSVLPDGESWFAAAIRWQAPQSWTMKSLKKSLRQPRRPWRSSNSSATRTLIRSTLSDLTMWLQAMRSASLMCSS